MTIDPVELERLSKMLLAPAYWFSGSSDGHEGENDLPKQVAATLTDIADKLRTGQLVPAQPSGDVVEAAWDALKARCCADPAGAKKCVMVSKDDFTAAITTYEAVSGVTKMRDALKKIATVDESGLAEYTPQAMVAIARAALGEKP